MQAGLGWPQGASSPECGSLGESTGKEGGTRVVGRCYQDNPGPSSWAQLCHITWTSSASDRLGPPRGSGQGATSPFASSPHLCPAVLLNSASPAGNTGSGEAATQDLLDPVDRGLGMRGEGPYCCGSPSHLARQCPLPQARTLEDVPLLATEDFEGSQGENGTFPGTLT